MVSGRYFFPNAPLLCLKRIPACAVMSVNSIGPEGRGAVGLGDGDGDAVAASCCCATGEVGACLQADMSRIESVRMNASLRIR